MGGRCAGLNSKLQTPNAKGLAHGGLRSFGVWRLKLSRPQGHHPLESRTKLNRTRNCSTAYFRFSTSAYAEWL